MDEHEYERAEANNATMMDAEVAAIRKAEQVQTHPFFDGEHCVSCGEQMSDRDKEERHYLCHQCEEMECTRIGCFEMIPLKRVMHGKILCVHCQAAKELKR